MCSATTSRAVPSSTTPSHGDRRAVDRKRAAPVILVGSRMKSRPPDAETGLAGHRSYPNRLVAA
jgi:hypothetical protein